MPKARCTEQALIAICQPTQGSGERTPDGDISRNQANKVSELGGRAVFGQKKRSQRDLFFALDSQSVPKTLAFEGQAAANINEIKHLYGGSVEIRTLG